MVPHLWKLYSIERRTGQVRWERTVHEGMPRMKRHVKASHASATPATDGTHVAVLAGSQGLDRYDVDGKLLWTRDLGLMDVGLVDDPSYQWGPASSPIIYKSLVIVQNDRQRDSSLAAFDVRTGAPAWQVTRDELPSWATPLVLQAGSRTELVTNSGKYIRGYDPDTGRELWRMSDEATQVKVRLRSPREIWSSFRAGIRRLAGRSTPSVRAPPARSLRASLPGGPTVAPRTRPRRSSTTGFCIPSPTTAF